MFQNKKLIKLLVAGVMTFLFVKFYIGQKQQAIETSYGMVKVLVASRDIPPRTQLTSAYLTTQMVPLKYMQPGAYMVKIPDFPLGRIKGKVTIAAVPEGAQITQSNLADPSVKDTGIAPLLPPGKRGYLLRLGNTDVADLILPGDHIDVMATFTLRKNDGSTPKATYTILQNILVVAVGKDLKQSNEAVSGKKETIEGLVVTLALEPNEAEQMALAQAESQNEISIVVRPHGETDIRRLPGVSPGGALKH